MRYIGPVSWRGVGMAAGFVALVVLSLVALEASLHAFGIRFHDDSGLERPFSIIGTYIALLVVLAATAIFGRVERRSWRDFGLRDGRGTRHVLIGIGVGLTAMIAIAASLWLAGGLRIRPGDLSRQAAGLGAVWALGFAGTALFEETVFRGYVLKRLTEAAGFPVAACITSLLFGLAHLSSGFDGGLALVNAVLIGGILALSVRLTGSLWWAIGFHAAWDWVESWLLGAADSGLRAQGALLQADSIGPTLMSGGGSGPEGSLLTFVVGLVGLIILVRRVRSQV
jgi:membrane protease YdiL (CAAX protease family)